MKKLLHYTNVWNDEIFGIIKHDDSVVILRSSELEVGTAYHNYRFSEFGIRWRIYKEKLIFAEDVDIEKRSRVVSQLERYLGLKFVDDNNYNTIDMSFINDEMKKEEAIVNVIEAHTGACNDLVNKYEGLVINIISSLVNKYGSWEDSLLENDIKAVYDLCNKEKVCQINQFVKKEEVEKNILN